MKKHTVIMTLITTLCILGAGNAFAESRMLKSLSCTGTNPFGVVKMTYDPEKNTIDSVVNNGLSVLQLTNPYFTLAGINLPQFGIDTTSARLKWSPHRKISPELTWRTICTLWRPSATLPCITSMACSSEPPES